MRTLGQQRAEFALNEVLNITCDKKEFKNFSAGAPSMILQNGFGQSLAFWFAKATDKNLKVKEDDKHIVLFDMIQKWLSFKSRDVNNTFVGQAESRVAFIKQLSTMDQTQYLTAQTETLALLEWVKRYANAGF